MKIALMLSGLPRLWRQSLPTQLQLFPKDECDVFFHFWDTIDDAEKQEIIDLLKPRAYRFEKPRDFSHVDVDPAIKRDRINIPSRMFSQYYSWRGVEQLVEPFKSDYTLGMRSRADLHFVYSIDHIFEHLKPNSLLIPWWTENELLSDLFALGGIEPILHYHRLYNSVRGYAAKDECNSELMLMRHLEQLPDLQIHAEKFQYFFVRRPHMENYTIEQAMAENPGRNKWLDPEVVEAHKKYGERLGGERGAAYIDIFRSIQLTKLAEEIQEKARKL